MLLGLCCGLIFYSAGQMKENVFANDPYIGPGSPFISHGDVVKVKLSQRFVLVLVPNQLQQLGALLRPGKRVVS